MARDKKKTDAKAKEIAGKILATPRLSEIDGRPYTEAQEKKLNMAMNSLFKSANGKMILEYIESITINSIAGPEVSDAHLRHLEGSRYLVQVIRSRKDKGERKEA